MIEGAHTILRNRLFNKKNVAVLLFLILLTTVVFYFPARSAKLKIAFGGFGPQDYVAEKLYPENFKKNFHNGILEYDHSFPMRLYYYLAKYFRIFPSVSMYPLIFLQTLLLTCSVTYLSYVMFKNRLISLLCTTAIVVGKLPGLNIARFGEGFGQLASFPLSYAFADAFWIFAIACFLKRHYVSVFFLLTLSIYCHPTMGFFAFIFVCSYILYDSRLLLEKRFILGLLLFIILVLPYYFSSGKTIGFLANNTIPTKDWLIQIRVFSSHWYPYIGKIVGEYAHFEFLPFIFLYFFYFIALRYQNLNDEANRKIITGSIACVFLSLMGIFFAETIPVPSIMKIAMQRSSMLISLFGVLYIVNYLYQKFISHNFLIGLVSVFCYFIILFSNPGISFLPIFVFALNDIISNERFGSILYPRKYKMLWVVFVIISAVFFFASFISVAQKFIHNDSRFLSISSHLWSPLRYFNPFSGFDLMVWGGTSDLPREQILLIATLCSFILLLWKKTKNSLLLLTACFLLFMAIGLNAKKEDRRWMKRFGPIAESYLDLQLWARDNTKRDALFAPDPVHYYGWRDYSLRSSFGNIREWGYTSFCYVNNFQAYREGRKRCREFGVHLENITEEESKIASWKLGSEFTDIAQANYYSMTHDQLKRLSTEYGIDYFIVDKTIYNESKNKGFSGLQTVYENRHYILYAAP